MDSGGQQSDYAQWKTFHDAVPEYWDEIENGSGFAEVPPVSRYD